VKGIREFGDALVPCPHRDVGQVGQHDIGSAPQQCVGVSGPVDTDDECESAVLTRADPGFGVLDDDRALRTHAESARGLQTVDADIEQVINPGSFQHILTVRARGMGRGCDTVATAVSREGDGRREERRVVDQGTVEVEDHRVVISGVDGDRQFHRTAPCRGLIATTRVVARASAPVRWSSPLCQDSG
jgi:hypothetical protein